MYTDTVGLIPCIWTRIAQYERDHGGRRPARIFMTNRALLELSKTNAVVAQDDLNAPHTVFGVPVCTFHGEGEAFYLSDEEA